MFKFITIKSHFLEDRGNNSPVKVIWKYTRLKECIYNSTQFRKQSINTDQGSRAQDLLGHFLLTLSWSSLPISQKSDKSNKQTKKKQTNKTKTKQKTKKQKHQKQTKKQTKTNKNKNKVTNKQTNKQKHVTGLD